MLISSDDNSCINILLRNGYILSISVRGQLTIIYYSHLHAIIIFHIVFHLQTLPLFVVGVLQVQVGSTMNTDFIVSILIHYYSTGFSGICGMYLSFGHYCVDISEEKKRVSSLLQGG